MALNGREVLGRSLPYTAFLSPNGNPDLDLRALRIINSPTAATATQRYARASDNPATGGFGLIVRSMTTAERDALLVVYEGAGYIDPEDPAAGLNGDDPDGAIVYNTTTGVYNIRQGGAWATIQTVGGAGNSLQAAYDGGTTIDVLASTPIAITDNEVAAGSGGI